MELKTALKSNLLLKQCEALHKTLKNLKSPEKLQNEAFAAKKELTELKIKRKRAKESIEREKESFLFLTQAVEMATELCDADASALGGMVAECAVCEREEREMGLDVLGEGKVAGGELDLSKRYYFWINLFFHAFGDFFETSVLGFVF